MDPDDDFFALSSDDDSASGGEAEPEALDVDAEEELERKRARIGPFPHGDPHLRVGLPPHRQTGLSASGLQPTDMDYMQGVDIVEDLRDESDPTFAQMFGMLSRPRPQEEAQPPLEFMLMDAEIIQTRVRSDMDSPLANHTSRNAMTLLQEDASTSWGLKQYNSGGAWYHQRKRAYEPPVMVPVVKLYGVTRGGCSVAIDVYGFYPAFRLRIVSGEIQQDTVERLCKYIEEHVLKSDFNRPRQIVYADVTEGFIAWPYSPYKECFLEFRLSNASSITTVAKHFAETRELEDGAGNVLRVEPYSGEDALTQFMVSKKLSGCGWVRIKSFVPPTNQSKYDTERCQCTLISDCFSMDVEAIPLDAFDKVAPCRIMAFDIECIKETGIPDPKKMPVIIIGVMLADLIDGAVDEKNLKRVIFMWHPSGQIDRVPRCDMQFNFSTEKEMLVAFASFVRAYDPDMYLGHNINGFDIPYLVVRANQIGVPLLAHLGRRSKFKWSAPREIISMRKNGSERKNLRVDTPGVVQIDTLPLMQGTIPKRPSYKLGYLGEKILGEGKEDVGYNMITQNWKTSAAKRKDLAEYCLKDVELSLGLAKHKDMDFPLSAINLARETRVTAARLLRSGNQEKVRTLVLHQAADPRWDAENTAVFFPYEIPKARGKDDKFQGASVLNAHRGVYGDIKRGYAVYKEWRENKVVAMTAAAVAAAAQAQAQTNPDAAAQRVLVLDYKSLYPSVMISNNMCYTTEYVPEKLPVLIRERMLAEHGDTITYATAPDTGTKFVHSDIRTGLLPRVLKHLLDSRDLAKTMIKKSTDPARKRYFNSKQLQLKIIANSVYGVLTASGGWFVRMEIGESVTSWGRQHIAIAKATAEGALHNAEVIYGDTDSIMVLLPRPVTRVEAFEEMKAISKEVTAKFPPPVELQPEKVYDPYILFGKKKYAGELYEAPNGNPKDDSKGIEKNRLDNCPLVRKMSEEVLRLLLVQKDVTGALQYIHDRVADLIQGRVEFSELVITKSISKSEYKGKQIHVEVAKRMQARDKSYQFAPGERIPFVVVRNGKGGTGKSNQAPLCERAEDPLWAITHKIPIDVSYYINNQLRNPIAKIMMFFIAPHDLLAKIKACEAKLDKVPHGDELQAKAAKKELDKAVEQAMDYVGDMLFGPGALMDIKRPVSKHVGPMAAFVVRAARDPAETANKLQQLRQQKAQYEAKCTKCRGYEVPSDTPITCQQRDCENLFRLATVVADIEDLTN